MKITSFETTADRRLGSPNGQCNLFVYALDARGVEILAGTILGFPDKIAAMEAGNDLMSGEMVFFPGRVEASTVREAA